MKSKKIISNKIIGAAVKVTIVLLAIYFVYKQVFEKDELDVVKRRIEKIISSDDSLGLILIVFLLMFLNWGIEAVKWQYMVKKVERITMLQACKAIFAGATISIFTPNRVGEYAGRIFHLKRADRIKGILITVIGSISQLLIIIIAGTFGLMYFISQYVIIEDYLNIYVYYSLIFLSVIWITLLLVLYHNTSLLTALINKIRILGRFRNYGKVFSYYSSRELFNVLWYSFLRYFVFSFQFYLLLIAFDVNIPFWEGMIMIANIFFTLSAVPTIALTELGMVRGSIALTFIGEFFVKTGSLSDDLQLGIITSSFALWVINVVTPALIGMVFIFTMKIFRKKTA